MAKKTGGKKGRKKRKGGGGGGGSAHHGGVMSSMRGGMKRAVGTGRPKGGKKSSTLETVVTVGLVLAVLALLFWRFA